ncbi:MAG: ABC transporter permease, partial [Actinomycetota bacterium]|nr:ABC transporter permease [Actinomycetota bacterium]
AMAWVFPVVPPIVTITLFADLTGSVADLPGFPAPSYFDWMAPGALLLPGMMGAGFTAVGLAEDLRGGLSERLRLVGAAPAALTVGRLAFDAARVLPAAALVLLVSVVLSEDVHPSPAGTAALLLLAVAWAMAWNVLFHVVARLSASPQAPQALLPLFAPVTFLSTVWLPAELMPRWAERIAETNPLSAVVEAARQWTAGDVDPAVVAGGVATIALWSAVLGGALALVGRRRR